MYVLAEASDWPVDSRPGDDQLPPLVQSEAKP